MYIIKEEGMVVPAYIYLEEGTIEPGCLEQVINMSSLPFVFHHTVLNSDAHLGYGFAIGSVVATIGAVIPYAVGYDISCGMFALRTNFLWQNINKYSIQKILDKIRELVPVGYKHCVNKSQWDGFNNAPTHIKVVRDELQSARHQIGSLGSGNHFFELQKGEDGYLWFMIHCGSRNFGWKICDYFHKIAVDICTEIEADIPNNELAFLLVDTPEGKEYLEAVEFAILFAEENRLEIAKQAKIAIYDELGCAFEEPIHINHNFVAKEIHFEKEVWVHRKGATPARKGQLGIIPGSQDSASYIVEGLGNPDSFQSCSHGAGRAMGRNEASRTLDIDECNKRMEGIVFGGWGVNHKGMIDLGEAGLAYKDIDSVMDCQKELVKKVVRLEPLGGVKDIKKERRKRRRK